VKALLSIDTVVCDLNGCGEEPMGGIEKDIVSKKSAERPKDLMRGSADKFLPNFAFSAVDPADVHHCSWQV